MLNKRSQGTIFAACTEEGSFIPIAKTDYDLIRDMLHVALVDYESAKQWQKQAPKESGQWNAIYKLTYDVFHALAEAFLLFDKIKARTHECLFAYLVAKHPELEFDWNFLEKIRTRRNRSIYYGEPSSYSDWKSIELQLGLYISALRKEIDNELMGSGKNPD